jgi:hypothetical protein
MEQFFAENAENAKKRGKIPFWGNFKEFCEMSHFYLFSIILKSITSKIKLKSR